VNENEVARLIVDAAYKVHTALGPGLLESVYEEVLAYELGKRYVRVMRHVPIPLVYEAVQLENR
jgi:GxxExxY protein